MKQAAKTRDDYPTTPEQSTVAHADDPAESWIHSLAGEWQSRWERVQNPQALSGAALLK